MLAKGQKEHHGFLKMFAGTIQNNMYIFGADAIISFVSCITVVMQTLQHLLEVYVMF